MPARPPAPDRGSGSVPYPSGATACVHAHRPLAKATTASHVLAVAPRRLRDRVGRDRAPPRPGAAGGAGAALVRARLRVDPFAAAGHRLVITSDNAALAFARAHRTELFPVPIVFMGVNGFDDAMLRGEEGSPSRRWPGR